MGIRNASLKTMQQIKLRSGWRGGVVCRVKSNVVCYLLFWQNFSSLHSDSKVSLRLPARIFKMPCFDSSALTFQAEKSIRKHLRMTKEVPRCQVSKWSFGSKGRTAACRLGGKLSGVLSHRIETDGVPRSYGKARALPVASPLTGKKKSFAMATMLCIFHLCYV